MMSILSILINILLLGALTAAVYYAWKLVGLFETFRSARAEMGPMMASFSRSISEAQQAIDGLKATGSETGQRLQKTLSEAKALAHELELMNAAGNSLAKRLENLAERNRRVVQGDNDMPAFETAPLPPSRSGGKRPSDPNDFEGPSFFIQDRDFDDGDLDSDMMETSEDLGSQAERELLAALRGKTHPRKAGG